MLRWRKRSATVLKSSGGGSCCPIWMAMFTAPCGLFISVDCSRQVVGARTAISQYLPIFSNCPCERGATTLALARALMYTRSAMSGSTFWRSPERLRALEFILRHPRVQQLLLVLLKHETRELHRLGRVELAPLEADAEVLQQRGVLPGCAGTARNERWSRRCAEPLGKSAATRRRPCSPCVEEHVELGHDERLGAREVTPLGHAQRELNVVELSGETNHRGFVEVIRSTWPRRLTA